MGILEIFGRTIFAALGLPAVLLFAAAFEVRDFFVRRGR